MIVSSTTNYTTEMSEANIMTSKNNIGIYAPSVGLLNNQFVGVADICELRYEMDRAVEMRRDEAMTLPRGWL